MFTSAPLFAPYFYVNLVHQLGLSTAIMNTVHCSWELSYTIIFTVQIQYFYFLQDIQIPYDHTTFWHIIPIAAIGNNVKLFETAVIII